MNPWSGAEPENEAMERELFARRARALGAERVPSLASVLRAARAVPADEGRETDAARSGRARAFVAMALAAACMMATLTKLPSAQPGALGRGTITADMDAGTGGAAALEMTSSCILDEEVLVSEERSCVAPPPLFTAAPELAVASSPPSCGSDEPADPDAVCR